MRAAGISNVEDESELGPRDPGGPIRCSATGCVAGCWMFSVDSRVEVRVAMWAYF